MPSHDHHTRRILTRIEAEDKISQRSLAKELGIALGLTNLLIRRIVKKGWVKVINVKPNRVRYLITPTGIAAKARITRSYLDSTLRLYTETRERIRERLDTLSEEWPPADAPAAGANGEKRIVFYGAGDVAEIGYICLQGTDLHLVGVVDDRRTEPFFGISVNSPDCVRVSGLNGKQFDRLVVMSFRQADRIRARLESVAFPADKVFWI